MQGWLFKHLRHSILLVVSLFMLISIANAQTVNDSRQHSRIIVQWKESKVRTRTQVMEAANTRLKNNVNHSMHLRRSINARMDAMQLDTSQHSAEFAKTLTELNANPDVEFAVEDMRRHVMALPDDPYFTASSNRTGQWYLNDPAANSQWVSAINAINAWNYSTGGSAGNGIIIADVDTGVRFDHPDLLPVASGGKLLPGYDFVDCDQAPNCTGSGVTFYGANDGNGWDNDPSDPGDWVSNQDLANHPAVFDSSCEVGSSSWHGTRVSGILGALTNNGIGIAGTGYNARILPVRALGKCGGFDSDIIAGMEWAAGMTVPGVPVNPNPAKIINLSLGSPGSCSSSAYPSVISSILARGITIVASAGNDSAATNIPANCTGVIGVTAIRNTGTKVGFSSLGPEITLSAPGGNCVNSSGPCLFSIDTTVNLGTLDNTQDCTQPGGPTTPCYTTPGVNDYTDESNPNLGTSFSAPIVSGTIALMLGANPTLSPSTVVARLKATATAFPQTAANSCVTPTGTTPVAANEGECNCTTSLCGAGMVNALKAVQSVTAPTITINGNTTVASGGTDMLDASTSTAADGGTLTYVWTIVSGSGQFSSTSSPTTTVTAPSTNETLVIKLTVSETEHPDNFINTASQNFNITVGSGASSSSSSASSSSSSASSTSSSSSSSTSSASSTSSSSASSMSSASSSSAVGNSSSASSVATATKGGGALEWQWLLSFAAVLMLRAKRMQPQLKEAHRYF